MGFAVTLIVTVFFAVFLLADCANSEPGRSAKWNAYMANKQERRNTLSMEWENKMVFPTCTLTDITTFDTLGRRASGVLAPVQNQGICGSCWAFASTHVFTDYRHLQGNTGLATFSQDQLTKCISPFLNRPQGIGNGCCGGWGTAAFRYFQNDGVVTGNCLPYTLGGYSTADTNKQQNPLVCPAACANPTSPFNPTTNRITGYVRLLDESSVIDALNRNLTVYATMEVRSDFFNYRCGVFCDDPIQQINHAVEIVDYSQSNFPGSPYWVVKNSWGTTWGEGGYFRIARNRQQLTGFLTIATCTETPETTLSLTEQVCTEQLPNDESDNQLIESAVEFGMGELNNRSDVMCADGTTTVDSLTLSLNVNGTVQVIRGFAMHIEVDVDVKGCTETEASITFTAILALNGTFSLTESFDYEASGGGRTAIAGFLLYAICMLAVYA